jgi:carbonic anhydrase
LKTPLTGFEGTSYKVHGDVGDMTVKTVEGDGPFTFTSNYFLFHAPSEHTIEGQHYDLEMHIVHKLSQTESYPRNQSILSVLFMRGEVNDFLDQIINDRGSIDLAHLFEATSLDTFFTYAGSTTTPPCTENVNWYIYGVVYEASEE